MYRKKIALPAQSLLPLPPTQHCNHARPVKSRSNRLVHEPVPRRGACPDPWVLSLSGMSTLLLAGMARKKGRWRREGRGGFRTLYVCFRELRCSYTGSNTDLGRWFPPGTVSLDVITPAVKLCTAAVAQNPVSLSLRVLEFSSLKLNAAAGIRRPNRPEVETSLARHPCKPMQQSSEMSPESELDIGRGKRFQQSTPQ